MRRLLTLLLFFCVPLIASACAPAVPTNVLVPLETDTAPAPLASPTAAATDTLVAETSTPTITPTPRPTFGPTPTETLLPTLDLPTLEAVEPALEVWDGVPTYLGDSQPGFYFRVRYNPRLWGLVHDTYGQPALGHREIEYCIISPGGVRGMPPGMQVEHDYRKIGEQLYFEINIVLFNGVRQFVTYQASDGTIFTSFEVNFVDQIDDCLAAAETVLGTLTSVPQSQATPVP